LSGNCIWVNFEQVKEFFFFLVVTKRGRSPTSPAGVAIEALALPGQAVAQATVTALCSFGL
jgi:hypothetical protein